MLVFIGHAGVSWAGAAERVPMAPWAGFEEAGDAWQVMAGEVDFAHPNARRGAHAARIERTSESNGDFSASYARLPVDFAGREITLEGWLRTEDVVGSAGLWLREDNGIGKVLEFDNMARANLQGTTDWTRYRTTLPLDPDATQVVFGSLLSGTGRVWLDDVVLRIDGRPIDRVAVVTRPVPLADQAPATLESGIPAQPLSALQVDHLALLGRVWGFVKYRHPAVSRGDVAWDQALFQVMPAMLAAADTTAAEAAIDTWLAGIGDPPPCTACAAAPAAPALPPVDGLPDTVGPALGARLRRIHENRDPGDYWARISDEVGNAEFPNERPYRTPALPDPGVRLLAVFRFWNIVANYFPYRDLLADWDAVLPETLPLAMAADSAETYGRMLLALSARVDDTHANIWSTTDLRDPVGPARLPVQLQLIDGEPVVIGYSHPDVGTASGLRIGDVLVALDDTPVASLLAAGRPLTGASNDAARGHLLCSTLTRGPEGPVQVTVARPERVTVATERLALPQSPDTHDHRGAPFRRLSPELGYLTLSSVAGSTLDAGFEAMSGVSALIIDIRNYPADFVVWDLAQRLVTEPSPWFRVTRADAQNPGAFLLEEPEVLQPRGPHFAAKIAVLVDESTLSQAEFTAMALRAAGARIVGSTTSGADGNVSAIPLPGGHRGQITGIGIFYPDGRPTQQVGIVPDVWVRPTAESVRAGRDAVLEAAVRDALGRELTDAERAAL